MKIIKTILDRPFLVILITAIIALFSTERYILHSLGLICVLFSISIIYTIIQKNWSRLTLSFMAYFFFLFFWFVLLLFYSMVGGGPQIAIGDSKFYSDEILQRTDLMVPNQLKLISKLDTIKYQGIESEYDAECLYRGPKKLIKELENKIISNKEFSKANELSKYPTKVLTHKNFNLNELKSVYVKQAGMCTIYIAFNKSNSRLYYSAYYYSQFIGP